MKQRNLSLIICLVLFGAGCASSPKPITPQPPKAVHQPAQLFTPLPADLSLPDKAAYSQKDPRWAHQTLGGSGESISKAGCVVTSAAIAMTNLGHEIDPSDLNAKLKAEGGYTNRGWLIWDGIRKASGGALQARFYDEVSADIIDGCMADGFYPLTRFILPNGRTHWAVIIQRSKQGYYMRDPLHPSKKPLLFPRSADAFKAVRCIGKSAKS